MVILCRINSRTCMLGLLYFYTKPEISKMYNDKVSLMYGYVMYRYYRKCLNIVISYFSKKVNIINYKADFIVTESYIIKKSGNSSCNCNV